MRIVEYSIFSTQEIPIAGDKLHLALMEAERRAKCSQPCNFSSPAGLLMPPDWLLKGLPELGWHNIYAGALRPRRRCCDRGKLRIKARVMDKVITTLDEDLATDLKGMKSRIRTMVPVALDILFEHLTGTNPRISMDAAKTILDRDGRLVPVSKTTVVAETAEGHSVTGTDDMVASELSAAMGALNGGESKTVQ